MSDINPFEHPPLYEDTQVITMPDLAAIQDGFIYQYDNTPRYRFIKRFEFLIAVGVITGIATWLVGGKKTQQYKDLK